MTTPDRPIFIVGVPRSGTTLLHRLLAHHPHVSWLSGLCVRFPARPSLNGALMTALDLPLAGPRLRRRVRPWEAYDFWEHHAPGFRRPSRDLTAADLTPSVRDNLPATFARLTTRRRPRLLVKLTGWPRLRYLHPLFRDARFVHIVRDGRAVAHSLFHVDFWRGHDGPEAWRWGPLSPDQNARWAAHNYAPLALAALNWEILLDAMQTAQATIPPDQLCTVTYEALCDDPRAVLNGVLAFAGLPPAAEIETAVAQTPIANRNDAWRQRLNASEQAVLEAVTAPARHRWGYA